MPVPTLRPYQSEAGAAILDSVLRAHGLTFTVEVARQGGKNELSAQIEAFLLASHCHAPRTGVKCAPTFEPQCLISLRRLKTRLLEAGNLDRAIQLEHGHILRLGLARQAFLSAARDANVVGATADLLLEVDEAQDVDRDKYQKEFRPMASTTNATTVLYGTPWDTFTLLEEQKQINLDQERKDGIKRHFHYDWQEVARYNPAYAQFVEAEKARLGEDHPLFKTQYALELIEGGRNLLTPHHQAYLKSTTPRAHTPPDPNAVYVAAIDVAGPTESIQDDNTVRHLQPQRDSTVLTIAKVTPGAASSPPEQSPDRQGGSDPSTIQQPHSTTNPASVGVPPAGGVAPGWPLEQSPDRQGGSDPLTSEQHHSLINAFDSGPKIEVLDHLWLTGTNHADLAARLIPLLKDVWHVRKVVVDATGVGAGLASILTRALSSREVVPFQFTAQSKSRLGYNLLAAINTQRLKLYANDNSQEYQELQKQLEAAQARYRPNQLMDFYVDPKDGHDDFLVSLALVVDAANQYQPRIARGIHRGLQ